jgi:hypothetical protein
MSQSSQMPLWLKLLTMGIYLLCYLGIIAIALLMLYGAVSVLRSGVIRPVNSMRSLLSATRRN